MVLSSLMGRARRASATVLMVANVFIWGIWCGGQYFNEAQVIPRLLSDVPRSVAAYNAIPTDGGLPFFFPLNPLFFLLSLLTMIAAWPFARRSRFWLAIPVIFGLVIMLALVLYLAPLISSISADLNNLPADELASRADKWRFGNRMRMLAELAAFLSSIWALRVWSAEAHAEPTSRDMSQR